MKKILILVDKLNSRHKAVSRFISKNLGIENNVELKHFKEINFFISKDKLEAFCGDVSLEDFDLVYFRRGGKKYIQLEGAIALFLKAKKIKFVDQTFEELGAAGNKLYKIMKNSLDSIPIISSVFFLRDKDSELNEYHLNQISI